jgi:hypothetical protein
LPHGIPVSSCRSGVPPQDDDLMEVLMAGALGMPVMSVVNKWV